MDDITVRVQNVCGSNQSNYRGRELYGIPFPPQNPHQFDAPLPLIMHYANESIGGIMWCLAVAERESEVTCVFLISVYSKGRWPYKIVSAGSSSSAPWATCCVCL